MNNQSKIWIATLTLTAILLAVILLSSSERPAQASMINAQPNFSLITAGPPGTEEALFIIDKTTQKMAVFELTPAGLNLTAGRNLGR